MERPMASVHPVHTTVFERGVEADRNDGGGATTFLTPRQVAALVILGTLAWAAVLAPILLWA
jgi:hypothetical protein